MHDIKSLDIGPDVNCCLRPVFPNPGFIRTNLLFALMLLASILCLIPGVFITVSSNKLIYCRIPYDSKEGTCDSSAGCKLNLIVTEDFCTGQLKDINGVKHIPKNSLLQYRLENFFYNHRSFVSSRNKDQLLGKVITDPTKLSSCYPLIINQELNQIRSPCGLAANAVFNDTYTLKPQVDSEKNFKLDESVEAIVYPITKETSYKNPKLSESQKKLINEWLPEDIFPGKVENAHFRVWMQTTPLNRFTKTYAKIKEDIPLPFVISVDNRYKTDEGGVRKSVVISQTSIFGGKVNWLGILYLIVSALLFICMLFMLIRQITYPRIIGDAGHLKQR